MICSQSISGEGGTQLAPALAEIASILDAVDASALIKRLQTYRPVGRRGYPLMALWRAHLLSYVLNLPHTNALIRRLHESPQLRQLCGFDSLPHRSTFNRFNARLSNHRDLVERCFDSLTETLAAQLPGFGESVAVDSTVVPTYSNPNRKRISDSDASWTGKTSARAKGGTEYSFGYKFHALVCARYGLPIAGFTTTASRPDTLFLTPLVDLARKRFQWCRPKHVIGDRGYDSQPNYQDCVDRGAAPIIGIRRPGKSHRKLQKGIYNNDAVPTCIGMESMVLVRVEPNGGRVYRCRSEGCHLKARRGVRYCHDRLVEPGDPDNPRLFGPVPRDSRLWKMLYGLRQSVERVFKSLKESRRLAAHCYRGFRRVALHVAMSALAFQATVAVKVANGQIDYLRWQVTPVP